ncbi:glycosyl hydrolase [Photobacterium aphoticum]|uniref:Glycosyl hydrolase n=1 Tax=Photobacterium aphoticum TaxID=754436 RepID=A0A0J1GLC3_9GAMM|nr:glycosyl hydrolase [Photobacterium aphoticum]
MTLLALSLTCQPIYAHMPVSLNSPHHHITISPSDLAISWNALTINGPTLTVNAQTQTVNTVKQLSPTHAQWQLQPSGLAVDAQIEHSAEHNAEQDALVLRFSSANTQPIVRDHPVTVSWFDLPDTQTQSVLLPFSEGMRVPVENHEWATYLTHAHSGANTINDLKMPFWTTEQNGAYITYHLVTATNNALHFSDDTQRVDMRASHLFTTLTQRDPFTVRITLGDDWLDGAKTYRQWRKAHTETQTLAQQAQQNPAVKRLIGASHVYLFGKDLLSMEDVHDWWGLIAWYLAQTELPVTTSVRDTLTPLFQQQTWLSAYHKQLVLDAIQQSLAKRFAVPTPSLQNNTIHMQYLSAQQQKKWLTEHAAMFLNAPYTWGQALSSDMLTTFTQAKLQKLWLGFDNWMPAFFQPNVVHQAKQAGYLVATYDSYNTAITPGTNDSWLTANLPAEMHSECTIELADGRKQKGFRGNGNYLNPNCHLDYVLQRVRDIIQYGQFNSLFLDVDATAMAREDYHAGTREMDMLAAFNTRMAKIIEQNQIVLGSEDGNSLTTQGITFAHGLESAGFGWTDKDMYKNKQSPYFLGRWYPEYKPEFFFQPAQVKAPYRTLLFSPQYRIPLYQAVFHDEIINNHHWHNDSLKFTNVKIERDLTAMLYNTPPMVHLTRDEALSVNSPRMKALQHYQAGFLPIHTQLWDKQLTHFSWLDTQGTVQQTQFSDGSTLIANFSDHPFAARDCRIAPHSILAILSNGQRIHWQAKP